MVGMLDDVEDLLGDQGIRLFLQPIQECRTRVISILPQLPTNCFLEYYQVSLGRRLNEGLREIIGDRADEL